MIIISIIMLFNMTIIGIVISHDQHHLPPVVKNWGFEDFLGPQTSVIVTMFTSDKQLKIVIVMIAISIFTIVTITINTIHLVIMFRRASPYT